MRLARESLDQSPGLDADGPEVSNAPEQFGGRSAECFGNLLHRRQRGVAPARLYRADVIRRQLRSLGEILKREPEGLSSAAYGFPEVHEVELDVGMPAVTTIVGVANQL